MVLISDGGKAIAEQIRGILLFRVAEARIGSPISNEALSCTELNSFHPESEMILLRTTPIGIHPKVDQTPSTKDALRYIIFDAVYTLKITLLLCEAEEVGSKTVMGRFACCQLRSSDLGKSQQIFDEYYLASP